LTLQEEFCQHLRYIFMPDPSSLASLSRVTESILCSPFAWCRVKGGTVTLRDASAHGGTQGGKYQVPDFAIAKYPITNAQYERFLQDPDGYTNLHWWTFSPQASQWVKDRPRPNPSAWKGPDLPRTRASWFDGMAFCHWLSAGLADVAGEGRLQIPGSHDPATWPVRLPMEQEWQRAALGDTGWRYPWGNELDARHANYGGHVGQPTDVGKYPQGKSIHAVMDMVGNVWEWCLTGWNRESVDVSGYTHRIIRGGAWNIDNPEYLCADDRGCHPPRGRLNDCGFRVLLSQDLQWQVALEA
jgi:formylglycine-generating enzyme required for sulfatase activity